MGTIQEKKTRKGEKRFIAMIRHAGINPYGKSFLRGSDAKAWLMQEEVRIQQGLLLKVLKAKLKP